MDGLLIGNLVVRYEAARPLCGLLLQFAKHAAVILGSA